MKKVIWLKPLNRIKSNNKANFSIVWFKNVYIMKKIWKIKQLSLKSKENQLQSKA